MKKIDRNDVFQPITKKNKIKKFANVYNMN